MKQLILLLILFPFMTSISSKSDYSWFELVQLEKKGYSITLDDAPIKLCYTYLNNDNVSEIKKNNRKKTIRINRKNLNSTFFSLQDLRSKNNFPSELKHITVDGRVLDSIEISETKFENESIKYLRLLTQKDYQGKEFNDLLQVKESVGKGILIIQTQ